MTIKQRWVLVLILLAILFFLIAWFSHDIVAIAQKLWNLDELSRQKLTDLTTTVANVFSALSVVASFILWITKTDKSEPTPVNITIAPPPEKSDPETLLNDYHTRLRDLCSHIDLSMIDEQFREYYRRVNINLPRIYQEMEAAPCRGESSDTDGDDDDKADMERHIKAGREPLLQAVGKEDYRQLVILGDPGSGKSMFIDNLAWRIAESHLDETANGLDAEFRRRPVIRVRLRSAALLLRDTAERNAAQSAETFLQRAIHNELATLLDEEKAAALWEILKKDLYKHGVFLLDGLDEIPETDDLREQALRAIDALAKTLKDSDARLIVTSRPYVFDARQHWLQAYKCLELAPMSNEQIEAFVHHWYQIMRPARPQWSEQQARKKAEHLVSQLLERNNLLEPARRPLLLTLLLSLHFANFILPHNRAELYQKAIRLMLERWTQRAQEENPDYPLEAFERKALAESESTRWEALEKLALQAHDDHTLQISADRIKALFSDLLSADCNATNLLDFVRYRSGILKPGQGDSFEFYHRSFQAYLAAMAIAGLDDWEDEIRRRLQEPGGRDWWAEVYLLLVSAKVYGGSKPSAVQLMRDYIPGQIDLAQQTDDQWALMTLAAQAMIEQNSGLLHSYDSPRYIELYNDLQKHLLQLVDHRTDVELDRRAEAGRLLGRLGDPRPGVTVITTAEKPLLIGPEHNRHPVPDIEWETIPEGTFMMGSDEKEAYPHEKPPHPVTVATFHISRYPITNAQYACFVEAGGYENEAYWNTEQALAWLRGGRADLSLLDDSPEWKKGFEKWLEQEKTRVKPWFWEDRRWNNPNHPVVGVSWYESLAFCRWLDDCLKSEAIPEDKRITGNVSLPSEDQWEYAARGENNWRYAWGEDFDGKSGNTEEAGLGRTSAVGLFPPGKAHEQNASVFDMTGNVWEWTASRWGTRSAKPDFTYQHWDRRDADRNRLGPMELRIIRGGSRDLRSRAPRCAYRDRDLPVNRYPLLGFRVVLLRSPWPF